MSANLLNSTYRPTREPGGEVRCLIDADQLPAFCPLPNATVPTLEDERLSHLFRSTLKLGRIHPLYLPVLKYRNARADRG